MIRIGNIDARQIRIYVPNVGAWLVDVDVDIASDQALPTGKQNITIGTAIIVGTVIAKGSGRFGESARLRVLGGAGAWDSLIDPLHFHNDAGVLSSIVTQATAAAIGETVVDDSPINYGVDFERVGDARFDGKAVASSVLEGRSWHVDANGITQVSPWPIVPMGADASVLFYSESDRVADMTADEVVWPGTMIGDARFDAVTVCEVDQTFTAKGSRVTAYCAIDLADRFGDAIAAVAGVSDPAFDKVYWYRISTQGTDGRLRLQAMKKVSGIPDTLPISVWMGTPGASAKFALGKGYGSQVGVYFLNGDRTQPRCVSFDGTPPAEMHFDAVDLIGLGANAASFVALADAIMSRLDELRTAFNAHLHGVSGPSTSIPTTNPAIGVPLWEPTIPPVAATKVKAE